MMLGAALLLGVAVGPQGLGLVSPATLPFVDPAVPVALVAIGFAVGLELPPRPDTILSIVLVAASGAILVLLREPSPANAVLLLGQSSAIALVIAAAGWLLLARSRSDTEQRVFVVAFLLLLGGAADALSLSALLSGFVAAVFLGLVGGPPLEHVRRHLQYLRRPFIVLILVVAGAGVEISVEWLLVAGAYMLLRTAILFPDVVAIAFALNLMRAAGPEVAPVLTVVVIGAIGAEIAGAVFRPAEATR
jgi:hypothetical protein